MIEAVARAKVNLGLHVLYRRADAFHEIRTVFVRIEWADRVAVFPDREIGLATDGSTVETGEGNLCIRAARALSGATDVAEGARIELTKRIPIGAGLGGGSSDAAATLRALCRLWRLELSEEDLLDVAAGLGSDVPVFLSSHPVNVGTGRGEKTRVFRTTDDTRAYAFPFALSVVVPHILVSTTEAYQLIIPRNVRGLPSGPAYLEEVVLSNDLERWRRELVNDFEEPVLARHPEIANVKAMLLEAGAGYASLSGSGSAVYGVFEDEAAARAAAEAGRLAGHTVWAGRASAD